MRFLYITRITTRITSEKKEHNCEFVLIVPQRPCQASGLPYSMAYPKKADRKPFTTTENACWERTPLAFFNPLKSPFLPNLLGKGKKKLRKEVNKRNGIGLFAVRGRHLLVHIKGYGGLIFLLNSDVKYVLILPSKFV